MPSTKYISGTVVTSSWLNDVDTATYARLTSVAGTNTVTATGPVSLVAYASGQNFYIIPAVSNTGAVTININSLGVRAITKSGTTPLVGGDLVAGSVYEISYDGTQFQLINPSVTSIANGGTGVTSIMAMGQCRLTKGGANVVVLPYNGNVISFPDGYATVPASGISLAPTGLTPSTLYYIYGVKTAGVLSSLEASTTTPVKDANTGILVKTGDATRRLQGMVRPITGPAFQDTAAQRLVISWDNPRQIDALSFFTANRTTVAGSGFAELNAEIRIDFLTWSDRAVLFSVDGSVINAAINGTTATLLSLDGSTTSPAYSSVQAYAASAQDALAATLTVTASEGYHYVTLLTAATVGNSIHIGNAAAPARCSIKGIIQG